MTPDTESADNVSSSREEKSILNCSTNSHSDQSAAIYSPSISDSLKTEPSSVSDLTLDLSDYCLLTLYGSSSSLVTPDARPRLSPAPSLAPKLPGLFCLQYLTQTLEEVFVRRLMNSALSCIRTLLIWHALLKLG